MSATGTLLRLDLRPSWRLAALIVGVHGIAGVCILAVGGGVAGALLAALVVALGVAAARDRALLRGRGSPRTVQVADDGRSEISFSGGGRCAVADGPRSVSRFLVILPLRRHSRRTVLVAADMLDPEGFRLLRLWALWGRLPGVASAQLPG